jgi:hypothetical protein
MTWCLQREHNFRKNGKNNEIFINMLKGDKTHQIPLLIYDDDKITQFNIKTETASFACIK